LTNYYYYYRAIMNVSGHKDPKNLSHYDPSPELHVKIAMASALCAGTHQAGQQAAIPVAQRAGQQAAPPAVQGAQKRPSKEQTTVSTKRRKMDLQNPDQDKGLRNMDQGLPNVDQCLTIVDQERPPNPHQVHVQVVEEEEADDDIVFFTGNTQQAVRPAAQQAARPAAQHTAQQAARPATQSAPLPAANPGRGLGGRDDSRWRYPILPKPAMDQGLPNMNQGLTNVDQECPLNTHQVQVHVEDVEDDDEAYDIDFYTGNTGVQRELPAASLDQNALQVFVNHATVQVGNSQEGNQVTTRDVGSLEGALQPIAQRVKFSSDNIMQHLARQQQFMTQHMVGNQNVIQQFNESQNDLIKHLFGN
jgi:hypothetical protein